MYKKIRFLIILFIIYLVILYTFRINYYNIFENEIKKKYEKFNKVNINEIDEEINHRNNLFPQQIKSIINIGFTMDKNFVLETMITIASIMATQKNTTKIRFHFGVTNNFTADLMIKMYKLRNRLNNITEFNFYYLKDSLVKMKGFHIQGEACPGKFELPTLLPNDIERLLIFDAGDLLVFKDLTELYNYNMSDYWAIGTPEPSIINSFMKVKYNITKYINIGSVLLNVKKLKENNFWINYTNNRNLTLFGQPDQTLFNIIIPDNKKNYLPFKFGGFTLFRNDKNYENLQYEPFNFKSFFNSSLSSSLPDNPKSQEGMIFNFYNPTFIHQFYGKWKYGQGLTIYRHLAKYFIILTGISKEICKEKPGFCI